MGVSLRSRCLAMPQNAADQRQPDASTCPEARECVPKVVDADVRNSSQSAHTVPFLPKTIEVPFPALTGEDPSLVARRPLPLLLQHQQASAGQRNDLRAGLASLLAQHTEPEVDLGPFETFDLTSTRAGQDQ